MSKTQSSGIAETVYAEFYDRLCGLRDDAYAIGQVIDDLAVCGYRPDRLKPVKAGKHGPYWHYAIPVVQVVR